MRKPIYSAPTEQMGFCLLRRCPKPQLTKSFRLRRKIENSPAKPRYILTEIGVGYRLMDE